MSLVSISKLISVNYRKVYPKPVTQPSLAEIFQSEPVKRLLCQPNIVIERIPDARLRTLPTSPKNAVLIPSKKKKASNEETLSKTMRPDISVMAVMSECNQEEPATMLPSKHKGKSEIALTVVKPKKKQCEHEEPCENIVCDVSIQQHIDQSGVLPLLAVKIDNDEINAPVKKHCGNPMCDTLSIEHNRCRRALIKLSRCDEKSTCDVCGIFLKTRRSRLSHKNCKRKDIYTHNLTNGAQILREKMRKRELELLQVAKTKKREYLDPVTEYEKTMETLKNNKELIVIAKNSFKQQSVLTITRESHNDLLSSLPQQQQQQYEDFGQEIFGKLLPSIPIVLPSQRTIIGKKFSIESNESETVKQPEIANVYCSELPVTSIQQNSRQQQFIKVASSKQLNVIQPVTINEWVLPQSQTVASPDNQNSARPYLTPIRVVPITSLKSSPSSHHEIQGIPTFCLVPHNPKRSGVPIPRNPSIHPIPITSGTSPKLANKANRNEKLPHSEVLKPMPMSHRKYRSRIKCVDKVIKIFKCPYCMKSFSTEWYFKMHVAGHKGEMLVTCKICEKQFSNRYDLKKHMLNDHNDGECRCEICGQISICKSALEIHVRSHTGERPFHCNECDTAYRSSTDLKTHKRKRHNFIECHYCHSQFLTENYKEHLLSAHHLTEDETSHGIIQIKNQVINKGKDLSDNLNIETNVFHSNFVCKDLKLGIKKESIDELVIKVDMKRGSEGKNTGFSKKKKHIEHESGGLLERHDKSKAANVIQNNSVVVKRVTNNSKKGSITIKPRTRRKTRHSKTTYQCTICKKNFNSSSMLEKHLATKPKEAMECCKCKVLLHSTTDFKKHTDACSKIIQRKSRTSVVLKGLI
ncbi:uncharacterized protein LOC105688372 isoform X1 [Athalia rosae]|uniref:uncharacterized protein LOC105688372 isoform X1 n=2 Tax=Athalia rosae TaxID=37344 RepID=UPI002033AFEE|nr:uncharacterized protein LOC105688372 isoform X1 [Athalia rosae]XP_012260037.2 uncharacterized protein LOC105688372 isoform X1 [Athalia rosae]XP_020709383.2 uncharacterized protein LOC105688372 isoform X1 [Athalia rosae]XP_048507382.1 uncharacterized protein LOC105688372 isoform X1 [Athalia rosae]XP_048507383.1 uncharacterized protein LOC105688372 isoform X1 [Athalia rosae]